MLRSAVALGALPGGQFRIWRGVVGAVAARGAAAAAAAPLAAPRLPAPVWPGLAEWRASEVDERLFWGARGPEPPAPPPAAAAAPPPPPRSLADAARAVLVEADPRRKAALAHEAFVAHARAPLAPGAAAAGPPPARPARPPLPRIVPPREVPPLRASALPLAAYLLHSLAHVELSALDLACDTVARFAPLDLPPQFYADFLRIADDEARHLGWCLQRLEELGAPYGAEAAHDLLLEGGAASATDVRARLAVVPLAQEARGLDAGARLAGRLVGAGDNRSAAVVARIAREERAHVAAGVAWFSALCAAEGEDPAVAFAALLGAACPDLLAGGSGGRDHSERELVGLKLGREEFRVYEREAWPATFAAEVAAASAALEATAARGGGGGGYGGALPLGELRARLGAIVAAEAAAVEA